MISTPARFTMPILMFGSWLGLFSSEMDEHKQQFTRRVLFEIAEHAGYTIAHYHRFELGANHLIVLTPTA